MLASLLVWIAFFFLKFSFAASLIYNYSTFNQQTQNSSYPENQTHNLYTNFFCPSISNYGSDGMDFFLSPTDFAFTDSADSALCLVTQKETADPTTDAPVEILIDDVSQDKSEEKQRLVAGTSMGVFFSFIVCISLWVWRNNKVDRDKDQGILNIPLNRGEQDEGLPDSGMPMNRLAKEDEAEVHSHRSMDNDDAVLFLFIVCISLWFWRNYKVDKDEDQGILNIPLNREEQDEGLPDSVMPMNRLAKEDEVEVHSHRSMDNDDAVLFLFIVCISLWFWRNYKVDKDEDQGVLNIPLNRGEQDEGLPDSAMPMNRLATEDEAEVHSHRSMDNDDAVLFLFIVCISLWFWRNYEVDKDEDQGVLNIPLDRGEQDEGLPDSGMPMNRPAKEDEAEVHSHRSMDNDDGVLFLFLVWISLWFWRNYKVDKDEDQEVLNIPLDRGEQDEGLPGSAMPMNRLAKEDEAEVHSHRSMDNDDGVDLYYSTDIDGTGLLDKSIEYVAADLHKSMDEEGFDLYKSMAEDLMKANGSQKFSFKDLADATNDFSDQIGEGGFGAVCKGFLEELNCFVAVKRVSRDSRQGIKEFASEVKIISQLRHRNILQLIGWCHESKELLLVYEFMSNGSLDYHLFKETSLLTWKVRYKIAIGMASGLRYLQEELEQYVVHRDIKASNVMLDSNFNPKLGDFGLARLVEHGRGPNETPLAGTPGYVAPEYSVTHKASKESDIYSFGIVALEIASGRKIIDRKAREDQINLKEWVWDLYGKGKLIEAADPRLNGDLDKQELECLMIVGLWCAHPDIKARPTIAKAIHVLNFVVPLPDLPASMPMVTDCAEFSMSSVGTDSLSEEEKLGKKGVAAHPYFDKWKRSNCCIMFCYEDLVHATENFSEQNKLEQKATGVLVYRGFLMKMNSFVAVNVVSKNYIPGVELIEHQASIISQLRHENLAKIIGWCCCNLNDKLILVFELMPIRNLDFHLFERSAYLTWEKRYRIAKGVAGGLLYLSNKCVLDEGIESSNVLLDLDFNVKLGNFGLETLANFCNMFLYTVFNPKHCCTPEYEVAAKRFVHSFGIIALEIACGRKHLEIQRVSDLYGKRKLLKAADPRLNGNFDKKEMEVLMVVGLWCTHPDPKFKPSMREAIQVLNFNAPLPLLPSK